MSGFFNRLAQRTLGTVQTVRPAIRPRFSQVSMVSNELPVADIPVADIPEADSVDEQNQHSSDTLNINYKPEWQKPEHNDLQSRVIDSLSVNLPPRQDKKQQTEYRAATLFEMDQKPGYENKRTSLFDKTTTLVTHNSVERIDPIKDKPKQAAFLNTPAKAEKNSDLPLVTKTLESDKKNEKKHHNFEDSAHPLDVYQTSEADRYPLETSKQQNQQAAKTINVTIGRVEVRAVYPAPAPVIKQSKAKNQSTLSLEDYLQQRQRGER